MSSATKANRQSLSGYLGLAIASMLTTFALAATVRADNPPTVGAGPADEPFRGEILFHR